MLTKTLTIPRRLIRLEQEVAQLKLSYLAKQRGIPTDDPALIDTIVKNVRRGRQQLYRKLYGSKATTAASIR